MKTRKTSGAAAVPQSTGKLKRKTLKLHKETLENLSKADAEAIKGGQPAASRYPCATGRTCSL